MHKVKNFILKTVAWINFLVFLYFACWIDVDSWIPFIICCITGAYLAIFVYANIDYINRDWLD